MASLFVNIRELWETTNKQEKTAELLRQAGQREQALEAYRKCLAAREDLMRYDGQNLQCKADLLVALEAVGEILAELGRPKEAADPYRRAVKLSAELADDIPTEIKLKFNAAKGHGRLAAILTAIPDHAGAAKELAAERDILNRLLDNHDKNNVAWLQELAETYDNLGRAEAAAGRKDKAIGAYGCAVIISDVLGAVEPDRLTWQKYRVFSRYHAAEAGDDPKRHLQQAHDIIRKLTIEQKLETKDLVGWVQMVEDAYAKAVPRPEFKPDPWPGR